MLCDIVKEEEKLTSRISDLSIAAPRASSAALGYSRPPSTLQEVLAAKKKADLLDRISARQQLRASTSESQTSLERLELKHFI